MVYHINALRLKTLNVGCQKTYKVTCHSEFYTFGEEGLVVIHTKLGITE